MSIESRLHMATIALGFSLAVAVAGLVYTAATKESGSTTQATSAAQFAITGNLRVAYMLVTSKTASSEEASGGTVLATKVVYFPTYVLVTTQDDATVMWPIDRLKRFEVFHETADKVGNADDDQVLRH